MDKTWRPSRTRASAASAPPEEQATSSVQHGGSQEGPEVYLVWFDSPDSTEQTFERILLFRDGAPVIRMVRPGAMLEAVQSCDWHVNVKWYDVKGNEEKKTGKPSPPVQTEEPSESLQAFLEKWESVLPIRWTEKRRKVVDLVPGRRQRTRIRTEASAVPAFQGEPGWLYDDELLLEGGNPRYMTRLVQHLVAAFLAAPAEPERDYPAPLPDPLRVEERGLRKVQPSERYGRLRTLIEQHEEDYIQTGLELWNVIESAYRRYHPFPRQWLRQFPSFRATRLKYPAFCFHASDVWRVVLTEIAWAIQHDVKAGRCRYPGCETWFLRPRRRGRKRLFCEAHQKSGPPLLYRKRRQEKKPMAVKLDHKDRVLRRQRQRGVIANKQFELKRAGLQREREWYKDLGVA